VLSCHLIEREDEEGGGRPVCVGADNGVMLCVLYSMPKSRKMFAKKLPGNNAGIWEPVPQLLFCDLFLSYLLRVFLCSSALNVMPRNVLEWVP